MQRLTIPSELKISKKIHCSLSYINKKGNNPPVGTCFTTNNITLSDKIEDNQWKFCLTNEKLKDQIISLQYCDEIIIITH